MAKNRIYEEADSLRLPVPAETESGDPVVVGNIPGVAVTDRDATDGKATVDMDGAYKLPVKAVNKAGNSKVAVGDIIYMKGTQLNKNNEEGTRFGYALEEVEAGAEAEIRVKIGY